MKFLKELTPDYPIVSGQRFIGPKYEFFYIRNAGANNSTIVTEYGTATCSNGYIRDGYLIEQRPELPVEGQPALTQRPTVQRVILSGAYKLIDNTLHTKAQVVITGIELTIPVTALYILPPDTGTLPYFAGPTD